MDKDKQRDDLLIELIEKSKGGITHYPAVVVQDYKSSEHNGPPDSVLLSLWLRDHLSLRGKIAQEVKSLADVTAWSDADQGCIEATVDDIMELIKEEYGND